MPALTPDNDIFISYSRKDISLVKPAISILKASGAEVFLDTEDIKYGEEWRETLDVNIREAERIFVFWSKNSAESEEVKAEYQKAIDLGKVVVIPVMLDKTPLPPDLAKYHGIIENDFGGLLQKAPQVNNPWTVIFRYGLPVLALALVIFATLIFVVTKYGQIESFALNTQNSSTTIPPEISPSPEPGNTNAGGTSSEPPEITLPTVGGSNKNLPPSQNSGTNKNTNPSNQANNQSGNTGPANRNTSANANATPAAPNPKSPIQARGEKQEEPPATDSSPLTYLLLLLLCITVLTALPAIFIWYRRRQRLIKAVRARLFPQAE